MGFWKNVGTRMLAELKYIGVGLVTIAGAVSTHDEDGEEDGIIAETPVWRMAMNKLLDKDTPVCLECGNQMIQDEETGEWYCQYCKEEDNPNCTEGHSCQSCPPCCPYNKNGSSHNQ